MFEMRVLPFIIVSGFLLSSCAPTFIESKTADNSGAGKIETTSSKTTPTLSEVRNRQEVSAPKTAPSKTITVNDIGGGSKIHFKLLPGFSFQPYLCHVADNCEPVKVMMSSPKNVTTHDQESRSPSEAKDIIAEVELSDETMKLIDKKIEGVDGRKKILIMAPDVELSELSAGGLKEPNALWTSAAKNYVTEFLAQYFVDIGYDVALHSDKTEIVATETAQDLVDLHEVVGQSIFIYQYNTIFQLPTKKNGSFSWTLGKTTRELKEAYGADLGLFVHIRDSYASKSASFPLSISRRERSSGIIVSFPVAAIFAHSNPLLLQRKICWKIFLYEICQSRCESQFRCFRLRGARIDR